MNARFPNALRAVAALLLCGASAAALPVQDADGSQDLADWSLEDLLRLRIPAMTGVLGGHIHNEGEWMPMVRYMRMEMDGLRDGTDDLRTSEVLSPSGSYLVAPTHMTMEAVMLGLMYGLTDELTLVAMLPYNRRSMDHRTASSAEFTTRSEGIGDLRLSAIWVLWETYDAHLNFNAGLSVPTGSIDAKDATPMSGGADVILPYPMQLGSGTVDLHPALTYTAETDSWGWGGQAAAAVRLGENDRGYALGDRYQLTGWLQRKWTSCAASSVRFIGQHRENIDGADAALNPAIVPTADPNLQGGDRLDLALFAPQGALAGHRLELEVGLPLYESLDGPQLSTQWWIGIGWSVTF